MQIYLGSQYATFKFNDTANTDMVFYFKNPIVPPSGYFMSLKLLNLYVPVSWTLVNENNDTLIIGATTYLLTHGNYNATTIKDEVQSKLSADSFSLEFSSITNKFTITNDFGEDFTISPQSTCLTLLGFIGGETSASGSLSSSFPIDLTGENMIYFDIRNISTKNVSTASEGTTSIIQSVLVSVPFGSVLYYSDSTTNDGVFLSDDHIGFLHVRILGEDAKTPLDLNNNNWGATLQVSFIENKPQPIIADSFKSFYDQYIQRANAGIASDGNSKKL